MTQVAFFSRPNVAWVSSCQALLLDKGDSVLIRGIVKRGSEGERSWSIKTLTLLAKDLSPARSFTPQVTLDLRADS